MHWQSRYLPPSKNNWQGRQDIPPGSCFFQSIHLHNLLDKLTDSPTLSFALLGFKSDEGVRRNFGRDGAAEGALAIRKSLATLPLVRKDVMCYDMGDILCEDAKLEEAQTALAELVSYLIKKKFIPILLGGGHEIAWGHYQGINKALSDLSLGIVNFDAHFDMRPQVHELGTSGTPFLQIAKAAEKNKQKFSYHCIGIQPTSNIPLLFDTAIKHHVEFVLADDIYLQNVDMTNFLRKIIENHDVLYASVCLDVFTTAFAPGVSAPQSLGLTPWQVIPLLRHLARSGKVISYDIAELAPHWDIDGRTAKLAACLIYEIIHHQGTL